MGSLQNDFLDAANDASEDTPKGTSGAKKSCQTHIDAHYTILSLDSSVKKVLKRFSEMMEENEYYESLLQEFVQVVHTFFISLSKDLVLHVQQTLKIKELTQFPHNKSVHGFKHNVTLLDDSDGCVARLMLLLGPK
ncbi:hypothetical protein C0989_007123 [Termitomyces sp. Mn162]|nr:hypothetical protein C0989_007123 [Termitomyces sp. Mn162]